MSWTTKLADNIEALVDTIATEINTINNNTTENKNKIDTLSTTVEGHTTQLTQLDYRLETLETTVDPVADISIITFNVDSNYHLIMQFESNTNLLFSIDNNGHLKINN